MSRDRLDRLLVARQLAPNRARAQALVLAGRVRAGGVRVDKPGTLLPAETPLTVLPGPRWVGRGALKLAAALEVVTLPVEGRDVLDVGASTGGFTQVLLEAGARRVAALDVGRGQLDWSLRNDPRVIVLDGINARYLEPRDLPFVPEAAVVDVSFISILQVLPAVVACLAARGEVLALVKPQFEVGRGRVGRGGVIRDPRLHAEVLERVMTFARERGWGVRHVLRSAVKGAEGNLEFFVHAVPGAEGLEPEALRLAVRGALDAASGPE